MQDFNMPLKAYMQCYSHQDLQNNNLSLQKTKARPPGIEPHFGMAWVFLPQIGIMTYQTSERKIKFSAFYPGNTVELL